MADYRCLECKEVFENKTQAIIHGIESKHQNYELVGTDAKLTVKA
jgi:hypothetical protein